MLKTKTIRPLFFLPPWHSLNYFFSPHENLLGSVNSHWGESHGKVTIPHQEPGKLRKPVHPCGHPTSATFLHDVSLEHGQCRLWVVADKTHHEPADKLIQGQHEFVLGDLTAEKLEPPLAVLELALHLELQLKELRDVFERSIEGFSNSGEVLELGGGWDGDRFLLWVICPDTGGVDTELQSRPVFERNRKLNKLGTVQQGRLDLQVTTLCDDFTFCIDSMGLGLCWEC